LSEKNVKKAEIIPIERYKKSPETPQLYEAQP